jgi:hypothetical protein
MNRSTRGCSLSLEGSLGSAIRNFCRDKKLSGRVKVILSVAVLAAGLWLGTNRVVYGTCVFNVFLDFSVASFALLYLRLHPNVGGVLCILGATAVLTLIGIEVLHYPFSGLGTAAFLGVAGISAIALRGIWSAGLERKRLALALLFAVLAVSANLVVGFFHRWVGSLTPRVLDLYLCSFDASLRVQFSFLMGRAYATWHRFGDAGMVAYYFFPLMIALVLAGNLIRDRIDATSAMTAFLISGPVGVIFYGLFPALGPAYVFKSRFPWYPLTIDQVSHMRLEPLAMPGVRNCMPSLHIAWVLLAWWYSRGLSAWERSLAMYFLVFTVFATLGSGEHYLIDLVVAVPFATFIYGLSALHLSWSDRDRRMAVWLGLGMTVIWIELLRFCVQIFWISPLIPWLACVATVVFATLVQRRLARFSERAIGPERVTAPTIPATA